MKKFDVYGLGNGLVDILGNVTEEQFRNYGYKKSSMTYVDSAEQRKLIDDLGKDNISLVSGGSVANSIIALSQLGGKGAFCCCLGQDDLGQFYRSEFEELGIAIDGLPQNGEQTGTALVLITPDAERTFRVDLGVAGNLADSHIDSDLLSASKWLFIEGYLFLSPEGRSAIGRAVEIARKNDCKIAVTLSDEGVVKSQKEFLKEVVDVSSLVFANEEEACAYTGCGSAEDSFNLLKKQLPGVVVTMGANGVLLSVEGSEERVDAFACDPVDLTGAGDIFAAALLYGLCYDVKPVDAARAGCFLASKVITQIGARLHEGARLYWDELKIVD